MSKVLLPVPKVLPTGKITKKPKTDQPPQVSTTGAAKLTREERVELRRLSAMLPLPARLDKYEQDPSRLLNDTMCYINHLVATIHARVAAGSLPREVLAQVDPTAGSPSTSSSSTSTTSSTATSPTVSPTVTRRSKLRRSSKLQRRLPKH